MYILCLMENNFLMKDKMFRKQYIILHIRRTGSLFVLPGSKSHWKS